MNSYILNEFAFCKWSTSTNDIKSIVYFCTLFFQYANHKGSTGS